ncbi:uncharacterized protein LOC131226651 [Magnolia sinica]|uniref:uncharacterized protein LOC131226651 n=1 Tax=Magnolia sinica TaxID=86752 RepID=UPI002657B5DE|nr:uncharacterized protein LOC131226651 [Magnolia sinica]
MTVLRSGAKFPKSPKCPSSGSATPTIQPSTPLKPHEHSNSLYSPSMPSNLSSPSDPKTPLLGLGFCPGLESSAPRRSLRLASKSNSQDATTVVSAGNRCQRNPNAGEGRGDNMNAEREGETSDSESNGPDKGTVDSGSGSRRKARGHGGNPDAGERNCVSPDADRSGRGSDLKSRGSDAAVIGAVGVGRLRRSGRCRNPSAGEGNGVNLNAEREGVSSDLGLGNASGESKTERVARVLDLDSGSAGGKSKRKHVSGFLDAAGKKSRDLVEDEGKEGVQKRLDSDGLSFSKENGRAPGFPDKEGLKEIELVSDGHRMVKDGENEGIKKQMSELSSCSSLRYFRRKSKRLIEKGRGELASDQILDLNSIAGDGNEVTDSKEAELGCNGDQIMSEDELRTGAGLRYLRRSSRLVGNEKRELGFDLNLDLNSLVKDEKEPGLKETECSDGDRVVGEWTEENRLISENDLGLDLGLGLRCSRRSSGRHEKGTREADIHVSLSLNSFSTDGNDNGLLNLCSGTRIVKRRIEVIDIDSDSGGDREGDGRLANEKETDPVVRRYSKEEKGKLVLANSLSVGCDVVKLDSEVDPTINGSSTIEGERRYNREEKGKGKLVEDNSLLIDYDAAELGADTVDVGFSDEHVFEKVTLDLMGLKELSKLENTTKTMKPRMAGRVGQDNSKETEVVIAKGKRKRKAVERTDVVQRNKVRFLDTAKALASKFAHFIPEEQGDDSSSHMPETERRVVENEQEIEDWPGPFSTAMRIIKDREVRLRARQGSTISDRNKSSPVIEWKPSQDRDHMRLMRVAPLLQDLCFNLLCKNAEAITSLQGIPDSLKCKLSRWLCDSRKMTCHVLGLIVSGSPSEICLRDCSWVTEDQLKEILGGCNTDHLRVLQFDLCGRCLPDYILRETLARSPNNLPSLITISLRGAYRLSDDGLTALVSSAPLLKSVNLGQCSLLTSAGIITLAEKLGPLLRELYIDECQSVDAMLILSALKKLKHLEVLSVAGVPNVCDKFVRELLSGCGPNMKELALADCGELTDSSLKVIAENCSGLHALDLGGLQKLTDVAMQHLANGCRSLQALKLRRNAFSDEGISAFLEASGESLRELSLNNLKEVAHNTAIALSARCSKTLCSLDLSWCRKLTDEALGLIVDKCSALRLLKLFGCTQITKKFLHGHSNPLVQIVGLKAAPILTQLVVRDSLEAALRY